MAQPQSGIARLILKAMAFSADRHRDQRRKGADALPYINHPIDVANTLANIGGVEDPDVLVAAILHDTIEDTATTGEELELEFGREVRLLVEAVTDDKRLPKDKRKQLQVEHSSRLPPGAKLIKLADKVVNVADVVRNPPTDWPMERRREYLDWTEAVVNGCRGVNASLERHYDDLAAEGRSILSRPSEP